MDSNKLPNHAEIPINALHASSIKAMSAFVQQPSAAHAELVTRLLTVLSRHPDRFRPPCGHNVYSAQLSVWQDLAKHMRRCADQRQVHQLH